MYLCCFQILAEICSIVAVRRSISGYNLVLCNPMVLLDFFGIKVNCVLIQDIIYYHSKFQPNRFNIYGDVPFNPLGSDFQKSFLIYP